MPTSIVHVTLGRTGESGVGGLPGITGIRGERGESGLDGFPGFKGDPGMPGLPGLPGIRGDKGFSGLPGLKGDGGFPGQDGPQVKTISKNIGLYIITPLIHWLFLAKIWQLLAHFYQQVTSFPALALYYLYYIHVVSSTIINQFQRFC